MKKDKIVRQPVLEDRVGVFFQGIDSLVALSGLGVTEAAKHKLQLYKEEILREQFNANHTQDEPTSRDDLHKRRFIAIFQTRYLELTDQEYPSAVTGLDTKIVSQVSSILVKKGFEVDDYLRWVFEVFIPDNRKFFPPTLKLVCSDFMVHKFLCENKDLMKEREEQRLRNREAIDLINRARILIRESPDNDVDFITSIKKVVKNFHDKTIMIDGLRNEVIRHEKLLAEKKGIQKEQP